MALPNVNITLANGTLGQTLQTADGVAGIVLTGATEGTVTAGTPFTIQSLANAQALGLTQTNNAYALKHIQEYFNEAGNGATLYVLIVPNTLKVTNVCDQTNVNGAVKLLNYAGGVIRLLGIAIDDTQVGTITVTNGLNADVYTALASMQAMATTYFGQQTPFRAVIGGTSFSGTATALTNQTTNASNRVSIVIGDTISTGPNAAVGLLLGRLSAIPVQRKVSRVKTGQLTTLAAYINGTDAAKYTSTATVHDRGYITFRTFSGKSGYFFTGDDTCKAATDDYNVLARGRVIDKADTGLCHLCK
ncbi:MAG: hypothetical protein H0X33_07110 [Taibaiella sp.]|nr:hypothetical protein [Taibaiella sp.]